MINEISTTDLRARIEAGDNIVLLDVRQPEEHAEQHIANTILIPLGELPERMNELEPHRNAEIVVICRSGGRSSQACMLLGMNGFTNVLNMRGGMLTW